MNGIFAEMRCRAMRRPPARGELQPQAAFVRSDNLQSRRLAHNGQVRLESAGRERARTGLGIFFVNHAGEDDLRFARARFGFRQFTQRHEHRGNGTFGIARAATVQAAVFPLRLELRILRDHGVEVRREQDGMADLMGGRRRAMTLERPGRTFWNSMSSPAWAATVARKSATFASP